MRTRLAATLAAILLGFAPGTLAHVVRCAPAVAERSAVALVRACDAVAFVLAPSPLRVFGAERHALQAHVSLDLHAVRAVWQSPSGPAPSQAPPLV